MGQITYREFQRFAEGDSDYARSSRDRSPRSSRSRRYDDEEDIGEDMRKLRKMVQKAVDAGVDVIECFEYFDTDGGGSIDEDEFYRGLQKLDFDVSRLEARKMLERFPGRRRGQIRIRDFMRGMKVDMSRHSEVDDIAAVQDEVRREIKRLAETRYGRPKFRQVFEEIDRDGGGTIDRREFKKALEQLGFELSSRVVKKLFKKFDTNYDGEIGYREFQKFAEGDDDYGRRSSRDRSPRSSRDARVRYDGRSD